MSSIKIIEAKREYTFVNWRELYQYRNLMFQFAIRDFKIRYVQTHLGSLWAVVNPVISVLLLSFVFGKLAKVDTMHIPSLLFTMGGLLIWNYFSTMTTEAGATIIGAQNMIKKIYFPKIILPTYKALTALIEMGIGFLLLLILFFCYQYPPSIKMVYLPLVLVATVLFSIGAALLSAAIVIGFRDFHHIIPHIVRFGLYISPVAYPATLVEETTYKGLYYSNPMVGLIEAARWCLFKDYPWSNFNFISFIVGLIVIFIGITYFSQIEGDIADSI